MHSGEIHLFVLFMPDWDNQKNDDDDDGDDEDDCIRHSGGNQLFVLFACKTDTIQKTIDWEIKIGVSFFVW